MTAEQRERMAHVMRVIQSDCESDAIGLDNRRFDGRSVGEQFGNLLAAVQALAKAIGVILDADVPPGDTPDGSAVSREVPS